MREVTVRNLRMLGVDKDENLLVVEGAVPGPKGGYLVITKAKKPPRERRGFAGAAYGRSVEGCQARGGRRYRAVTGERARDRSRTTQRKQYGND